MSTTNFANPPSPQPSMTISDVESIIASSLESLRPAPLSENITAAFPYLLPKGMKLRVQLEEDGRKKRSTADASNWNPETGEIVIYFEPGGLGLSSSAPISRLAPQASEMQLSSPLPINRQAGDTVSENPQIPESDQITRLHVEQCCNALAEAEKAGKSFIALRWFRDSELMNHGYSWANSLSYRQAVITKAIDLGAIITASIPNPRAPQHPTTTIKLNRESQYAQSVPPRFQPVRLRGEGPTASEILLRDRERL